MRVSAGGGAGDSFPSPTPVFNFTVTDAEKIAERVLSGHAGPYCVLQPTQFVARQKVVAQAARAIEDLVKEAVRNSLTQNPT